MVFLMKGKFLQVPTRQKGFLFISPSGILSPGLLLIKPHISNRQE